MKYLVALVAVIAILTAVPSMAAEKIAVLNLEAAIFATDKARKRAEQLKNSPATSQLTTKIEALNTELKALNDTAQKNRMTWSAEQGADHKNKMEYKLKERQIAINTLQQQEKAAMQELIKELGPKADQVVREVIEGKGITLLLKANAAHWASDSVNITKEVTEKLNGK